MDHEEAVTVLLAYMFSGAVGHAEGKCVSYSHLSTTPATSTWIAALEDEDSDVEGIPINRFRLDINRHSRAVVAHKLIALSDSDLADCILIATGHRLESAARSADGSFSISYKISVHEDPELQYIVQLRFHADVTSMNLLMQHISSTVDPNVLPLPQVFPIPNEQARQQQTGVGRQIARWVDGQMAHSIYPSLPHESRLVLVRDIARAYEALWDLPLPQGATNRPLIGELRANVNEETGETVLDVGPERHYSLGGPFTSTRDYLRGHIRFSLAALEKQEGIEEYKDRHLARIKAFVETGMPDISAIVEDVPIVAMHSDMGLHQ